MLPGVSNAAGAATNELAKKGIQMAGSGIVAATGSIPATMAENGVNNIANGTNIPLTEGIAENMMTSYVAGTFSGALVPQSALPDINITVASQSAVRQMVEEVENALVDQAIGDVVNGVFKEFYE